MNPLIENQTKSTLDYALEYAAIGWHVLPLTAKTKEPAGWLVPNGVHGASIDPALITKWFTASPDCNIGIALKPSGLVAVDIDPRNDGLITTERLEELHGKIESDVYAFTGGGGFHFVFKSNANKLPGTLGKGIDLKADGYIVVEPSIHPNGKQYIWEASSNPLDGCIPSTLPDWINAQQTTPFASTDTFVSRYIAPEQIRDLKAALPFIACEDYHQWIKIGHALKGAGAAGFELWDNWSKTSEKYDPAEMG